MWGAQVPGLAQKESLHSNVALGVPSICCTDSSGMEQAAEDSGPMDWGGDPWRSCWCHSG